MSGEPSSRIFAMVELASPQAVDFIGVLCREGVLETQEARDAELMSSAL